MKNGVTTVLMIDRYSAPVQRIAVWPGSAALAAGALPQPKRSRTRSTTRTLSCFAQTCARTARNSWRGI